MALFRNAAVLFALVAVSLTAQNRDIGARRPDLDSGVKVGYELAPGYEFTADPGADGILGGAYSADDITALTGASAWVVGQSFSDPQDITKGYEGAAMDVSIYSTFVAVKH